MPPSFEGGGTFFIMLKFLSYIGDFFKWLWKLITTTTSFILTLPGLVLTSVSTLFISVKSVLNALFGGSSVIDSVISQADSSLSGFDSVVDNFSAFGHIAFYSLSFDILFSVGVSILTFLLTFLLAVLTFFLVSVPVFLVQYYVLKISAKVFVAFMPEGWIPSHILSWIRYDASKFILDHSTSMVGSDGSTSIVVRE